VESDCVSANPLSFAQPSGPGRESLGERRQFFENLLTDFLRFPKEFLILNEEPVQFQRLVRGQLFS